jgi:acyl carrier protein
MLTSGQIADRISSILVERLGIEAGRIAERARIEGDLEATSIEVLETIMSLEDEFDIAISDREAEKLETVGDVIALVREKLH